MKDIRLYIANKRVDCSEELSLPITYQLEDFNNPTLVKNSFSKTITIQGTKNNNKIFGEIYKLDRMQHYEEWTGGEQLVGINFDPSKRTDFQIFADGDLIESGYVQLNDISIDNGTINYNITLYGGIGDFFYGLKYNEDGTTKTLADLRYFVEDNAGNVLPSDSEMDFNINKNFVWECFRKDHSVAGNKLTDYITFVPAYNGEYEDFDTSKCLINTNGLTTTAFPTSVTDNNVTYTTYNGYAMANLNDSYNEWQMRDLRSYYQRPAIRMAKLIQTICRVENSGYNVTFDPSFFNTRNPYWWDTFLTLPLLTSNEYEEATVNLDSVTQFDTSSYWFGKKNSSERTVSNGLVRLNGTDISVNASGVIDTTALQAGSTLNLEMDFKLLAHPTGTNADALYLYAEPTYPVTGGTMRTAMFQYHLIWLSVLDANTDQELGHSSAYQFQNSGMTMNGRPFIWDPGNGANVIQVSGFYKKGTDGYHFESNDGDTSWNLKLNGCQLADRIKVVVHTTAYKWVFPSAPVTAEYILVDRRGNSTGYSYWAEPVIESATGGIVLSSGVSSGKWFNKATLLKTEKSPADFLLDYTKLFGLYFIKDIAEKSIYICNRNTFFTGNVVDWNDRIDYSKNVTVTPILFDKKYYLMSLDTPETKFANRYQNQYAQEYGQQRLSTGYNFNYDTYNLYNDNIYQQIVPVINSNRFYRTFYDKSNHPIPAFLNDNCSYTLYNGDDQTEVDLYGVNIVNTGATVEWNQFGSDCWAKSCFFTSDNDKENLEEISSCLLMWNGLRQMADSQGDPIYFWITDDISAMTHLNEGACYLYTESEYDINGNNIAKRTDSLPQFLNCDIINNNVVASLDFGMPKEIYCGNVAYSPDVTVYANFWKKFYYDQFHIDTKKVTCYVKLDRMNQDYLRDFYYFDNAVWILNKVDSYDITSDNTVRCEFVKVQDVNNYTNGQMAY